ncbi:MAG: 16S rRNA (guanine(527)-N(7))-methyltransferase RsmG [Pyrinomonadaceae bacterium]
MDNGVAVESLKRALIENMGSYGVDLSPEAVNKLGVYYDVLLRWNKLLHLVAPCSTEEFARRHLLESLVLIKHLPEQAHVADVGSGAGLPIIPCLIARADLYATLIEASKKKAIFLHEVLKQLDRKARIRAETFQNVLLENESYVTCRALDEFIFQLPELFVWAPPSSTLLLFGGDNVRIQVRKIIEKFQQPSSNRLDLQEFLLPLSERRFLFSLKKTG